MPLRVIIPKRLIFEPERLARAITNGLDGGAKGAKVDFGVTVQTWQNKPEFTINEAPGERIIGTDDEVYGYVNDGTDPHIIVAKSAKALAFQWGGKGSYKPKSSVRVIGSSGGGASGPVVKRKRVKHPGTAAREFDEVIAEKWRELLPQIMQRAIDAEVS